MKRHHVSDRCKQIKLLVEVQNNENGEFDNPNLQSKHADHVDTNTENELLMDVSASDPGERPSNESILDGPSNENNVISVVMNEQQLSTRLPDPVANERIRIQDAYMSSHDDEPGPSVQPNRRNIENRTPNIQKPRHDYVRSDLGDDASMEDFSASDSDPEYCPFNLEALSSSSSEEDCEVFDVTDAHISSAIPTPVNIGLNLPEIATDMNINEPDENVTTKKKKIFPAVEKLSRKRKREPEKWKKTKAAIARAKGDEYVSYKGELVPKKKPTEGMLCRENCKLKCNDKFSYDDRVKLFQDFYKLDTNSKNALLFGCIDKVGVARRRTAAVKHKQATYKYKVIKDGTATRVCKKALCTLYQIGVKKVDIVKKKIDTDGSAPNPDRRGKHTNRPQKVKEEVQKAIEEHINKFPVEESHYSRNKNPYKKYLSPLINQTKMYKLYIEECDELNRPESYKVKLSSYMKIFSTKFNLSFGNPKSDTCSKCDSGETTDEHREFYKMAAEAMKKDKEKAKTSNSTVFLTMDLQQTMPLPKLTTSKAFYLRQLWFYNFGVHILTNKTENSVFCTWTEDVADRGSSEIASCLLRYIETDQTIEDKDHLIIWSDSAAGQNKNFNMICLYQYLILKGYFRVIDHKFPEVGHTYLDSDRDFGRIEKVLRKHETIYVPDQYRQIITKSSRKNLVIDMTEHFRHINDLQGKLNLYNKKKDELKENIKFRDGIKWIRVDEYGAYLYKETYDEYTPFKNVKIIKNIRLPAPLNIEINRFTTKYGTVADKKKENLRNQLKFVKEEYRYFYENILSD